MFKFFVDPSMSYLEPIESKAMQPSPEEYIKISRAFVRQLKLSRTASQVMRERVAGQVLHLGTT
jgi:hypothetical protein